MVYSGFWRRVGAGLIDSIVLQIITGIILSFFGISVFDSMANHSGQIGDMVGGNNFQVIFPVSFVLSSFYYAYSQSSKYQATLGMRVFSIRIVGYDGKGISFLRAFGRFLATYLSAILLCIGFLMIAFTPRKQALHDYIAKTLVIKD